MTSHRFYRDMYDTPFNQKADRRVFGYGELSDGFPGMQGAIHGVIGRVDGMQTSLVTGFAVSQTAGDTWDVASGYAYITGEFYELTPGAVTLHDNYYLFMSATDGSFTENATKYGGGVLVGQRSASVFTHDYKRTYVDGTTLTDRITRPVQIYDDFAVSASGFTANSGVITEAYINSGTGFFQSGTVEILSGTTAKYTTISGVYITGIDAKYTTISGTIATIANYEAVGGANLLGHNNATLAYATGTKIQNAIYGLDTTLSTHNNSINPHQSIYLANSTVDLEAAMVGATSAGGGTIICGGYDWSWDAGTTPTPIPDNITIMGNSTITIDPDTMPGDNITIYGITINTTGAALAGNNNKFIGCVFTTTLYLGGATQDVVFSGCRFNNCTIIIYAQRILMTGCEFRYNATSTAAINIIHIGSTAQAITITGCSMYVNNSGEYTTCGIYVNATTNPTGIVITGNKIEVSVVGAAEATAISLSTIDYATVSGNYLKAGSATGTERVIYLNSCTHITVTGNICVGDNGIYEGAGSTYTVIACNVADFIDVFSGTGNELGLNSYY